MAYRVGAKLNRDLCATKEAFLVAGQKQLVPSRQNMTDLCAWVLLNFDVPSSNTFGAKIQTFYVFVIIRVGC